MHYCEAKPRARTSLVSAITARGSRSYCLIRPLNMGSATMLLALVAVCYVFASTEAASSSCPLPSKVYSCSPSCKQNYDCSHGKVCCPNSCNAKSCAEPAPYGHGSDKYSSSGGAGIYCGNVKCSPHEVCKLDSQTKRQKCARS